MGGLLDQIANYNPTAFVQGNRQREANIAATEANTAGVQAVTAEQQTKNDLLQQQLRDEQIQRSIFAEAGKLQSQPGTEGQGAAAVNYLTDPRALMQEMIKRGASLRGAMGAANGTLTLNSNLAKLTKEQLDAEKETHQQVANGLQGYLNTPDEQKASVYPQFYRDAIQREPGLAQELPQPGEGIAPTQDELAHVIGKVGLFGTLLNNAKVKQETETSAATAAKANAETEKAQTETANIKRTQAIQELSSIADPQTGAVDPQAFAAWQKKYPNVAPASNDPKAIMGLVRSAVPVEKQPEFDLNGMKARMGVMGNSEYDQFLAQYAKSLGKTPAQLTPQEAMGSFQKFAEFKQDPVMRGLAIAQKNLSEALARVQLEGAPTKEDAAMLANDIINHRLAPDQISQIRGRGNGALGLMIERELKKQNPDFNWEEASAEYNLSKSQGFQQNVRYMDYVGSSINNVIAAADKLKNGKVRSLNAVKNWGANQLNGVDIARFNTDRLEVSDAIAKILQGGGTGSGTSDMKLKQAQDLIKETDDPEVVRTVAGEIQGLIANRRKTLTKGTFMENAEPTAPAAGGKTYAHTATGSNGHKIGTNDNGKTWYDVQTGQKIQ